MKHEPREWLLALTLSALAVGCAGPPTERSDPSSGAGWDGTLVLHGTMHEAIGLGQHQGRIRVSDLTQRPHFYGVAALEGLEGEVTIVDGRVVMTGVDADGSLRAIRRVEPEIQATLLVGAYVSRWSEHEQAIAIRPKAFDVVIAGVADGAGLDIARPFIFTVDARFSSLTLHVINGACPIRARLTDSTVPAESRPYEAILTDLHGTLVGIYAPDAAGELTHPNTSTHVHVVYDDPDSGAVVTGHVESMAVAGGARIRVPGVSGDSEPTRP